MSDAILDESGFSSGAATTGKRYTVGPACGGEPPYVFVIDELVAQYPIIVTGANLPVAEQRAKWLASILNGERTAHPRPPLRLVPS